jgi:hypothetical protein
VVQRHADVPSVGVGAFFQAKLADAVAGQAAGALGFEGAGFGVACCAAEKC